MNEDYYSNILGSGAANMGTALLFLLIWIVRNKCKHCKCNSHTSCCDIEINDEEEPEEESEEKGEFRSKQGTFRFSNKAKEGLQKMFESLNCSLYEKRKTVIQIN